MPHTVVSKRKIQFSDFAYGKTLGEGAYGKVVHAKLRHTGEEYAIKIMEKSHIKRHNKVEFVKVERSTMSMMSHPKIIKLFSTFQDKENLYMVMELCRNGTLFDLIKHYTDANRKRGLENVGMSLNLGVYFIASIVDGLRYLHENMRLVHRDFKPENILLDGDQVKIADFGTCKAEADNTVKFCGSNEYLSPEVLAEQPCRRGSDLWALGCIIYQVFSGHVPFQAETEYLMYQTITNFANGAEDLKFPDRFPTVAKDLVLNLLVHEPHMRLGAGEKGSGNDYSTLLTHPFFEFVDMEDLKCPVVLPQNSELPTPWKRVQTTDELGVFLMNDEFETESISTIGTTISTVAPSIAESSVAKKVDRIQPDDETLVEVDDEHEEEDSEEETHEIHHLHSDTRSHHSFGTNTSKVSSKHGDGSPRKNKRTTGSTHAASPKKESHARTFGSGEHIFVVDENETLRWSHHLYHNEQVLLAEDVVKRKGFSKKQRKLLLTSQPRLVYINTKTGKVRGEVPWSFEMSVEAKSHLRFDVKTPGRTYYFFVKGNAQRWEDGIVKMQRICASEQ